MKTIKVNVPRSFEIKIENGLIIKDGLPDGFVITDENVYKKYKNLIKKECFVIEPGEKSKSLETYKEIIKKISNSDKEKIISFGGGVVEDLAGFVASTYKRGVDLIHVPTTLVAMVDSSIGGKNGVNFSKIKNYIGTIYQPKSVLIDTLFLQTLPEKEFKNGLAEIIKYFAIFGKPSLEDIKKTMQNKSEIENIISECCKIKAKVVEEDEYDKGYRHTLNFGHTIGHAIELLCGLSHGEAISIGMIKEMEIGRKLGFVTENKIKKIREVLNDFCLPTDFPSDCNLEKMIEIMKYDKKGKLIFALDKTNYKIKLDEKIIREVLK